MVHHVRRASILVFLLPTSLVVLCGQTNQPATNPQSQLQAPPISTNAAPMSRQTRSEIIRDFQGQMAYACTAFPMGKGGLTLKDGITMPNGEELQQLLTLLGPALTPGDPAYISFVQIKDDHIHFDINGGAIHREKWYQHIQISGANGQPIKTSPKESPQNMHGSYLDIYFDKYVPEMTAQQLRDLLLLVLDFSARSKEEAYLNTVPPEVKEAILAHRVLVGMNSEMVLRSKGNPPKKTREKDGDTEYEEWIYGEPPQEIEFIRMLRNEVVRIETMTISGEQIVRTEKEVLLPNSDTSVDKKDKVRPPAAPTLHRPGEAPENVPGPSDSASPTAPAHPPSPQLGLNSRPSESSIH